MDASRSVRSDEARGFVGGGRLEMGENRRRTRSYNGYERNDFMYQIVTNVVALPLFVYVDVPRRF